MAISLDQFKRQHPQQKVESTLDLYRRSSTKPFQVKDYDQFIAVLHAKLNSLPTVLQKMDLRSLIDKTLFSLKASANPTQLSKLGLEKYGTRKTKKSNGTISGTKINTDDHESLTIYVTALALNTNRRITVADVTEENLSKYSKIATAEKSVEHVLKLIPQDNDWTYSAVTVANYIKTNIIKSGGMNYKIEMDKGTGKIKSKINKKALELLQKTNTINSDNQLDKWNPADMWVFKKGYNIDYLKSVSSIKDLNLHILEDMNSLKLIPISLKKVVNIAKGKEYNTPNHTKEKHKFSKLIVTKSGKAYSNYMGHLHYDNSKVMNVYAHEKKSVINKYEIAGGVAHGGGMGEGPIVEIYEKINFTPLRETEVDRYVNAVLKAARQESLSSAEQGTMRKMLSCIKTFQPNYTIEKLYSEVIFRYNEKSATIESKKSAGSYVSKNRSSADYYLSTKTRVIVLLHQIQTLSSQALKDELVNKLVYYAESKSDWSAPYIKIS